MHQKEDTYEEAKVLIMNDPELDPEQKQQRLKALLDRIFSSEEAVRIRRKERMEEGKKALK